MSEIFDPGKDSLIVALMRVLAFCKKCSARSNVRKAGTQSFCGRANDDEKGRDGSDNWGIPAYSPGPRTSPEPGARWASEVSSFECPDKLGKENLRLGMSVNLAEPPPEAGSVGSQVSV